MMNFFDGLHIFTNLMPCDFFFCEDMLSLVSTEATFWQHAACGSDACGMVFQLRRHGASFSMRQCRLDMSQTVGPPIFAACHKNQFVEQCRPGPSSVWIGATNSVRQEGVVYGKTVQLEDYGNAPELWKITLNDYKNNRIKLDTLKQLSLKYDYIISYQRL